jgi:hypothetical protein
MRAYKGVNAETVVSNWRSLLQAHMDRPCLHFWRALATRCLRIQRPDVFLSNAAQALRPRLWPVSTAGPCGATHRPGVDYQTRVLINLRGPVQLQFLQGSGCFGRGAMSL